MKHKLNKKFGFDDMEVLPIFPNQSQKLLRKEMTSTLYEYYLVGDIGEPDDYIELCDILRSASPDDEVLIRFNSGGGLLSTGDMIINAINESQANVHGFIEHSCGSMATMIFLQCHSWSLSDSAEFFVHNASGGSFGKENENYASTMFARRKIHRMIKNRYAGFLSDVEIENVLNGQDYYFDAEEISSRLESYSAYHQEKFMQEMEALEKELLEKEIPDNEKEEPMFKKQLLS